jgi:hypothetical protein
MKMFLWYLENEMKVELPVPAHRSETRRERVGPRQYRANTGDDCATEPAPKGFACRARTLARASVAHQEEQAA